LLFFNIDKPSSEEIKEWMKKNQLSISSASQILGLSKRQFSRFLSGETHAKRIHALAMQMIWLINENEKKILKNNKISAKKIKIPIK